MNAYVYLYTMSSYICVNPSVLPHNLSEKTWQSSWVARRSSYQRSKQSNMRSGSQPRSIVVALCSCAPKLLKMMPKMPQESQKMKNLTFERPRR